MSADLLRRLFGAEFDLAAAPMGASSGIQSNSEVAGELQTCLAALQRAMAALQNSGCQTNCQFDPSTRVVHIVVLQGEPLAAAAKLAAVPGVEDVEIHGADAPLHSPIKQVSGQYAIDHTKQLVPFHAPERPGQLATRTSQLTYQQPGGGGVGVGSTQRHSGTAGILQPTSGQLRHRFGDLAESVLAELDSGSPAGVATNQAAESEPPTLKMALRRLKMALQKLEVQSPSGGRRTSLAQALTAAGVSARGTTNGMSGSAIVFLRAGQPIMQVATDQLADRNDFAMVLDHLVDIAQGQAPGAGQQLRDAQSDFDKQRADLAKRLTGQGEAPIGAPPKAGPAVTTKAAGMPAESFIERLMSI